MRTLLQGAGVSHVRAKALTEYQELVRSAFKEFVNIRIRQRLDLPTKEKEADKPILLPGATVSELNAKSDDEVVPTALELEVYNYIKQRLAFLTKDDHMFEEINWIDYRNYKGKLVVFYKKERLGRLFDFYEGRLRKYGFDFGLGAGGEIATDKLAEIDNTLAAVFAKRVSESEAPVKRTQNSTTKSQQKNNDQITP